MSNPTLPPESVGCAQFIIMAPSALQVLPQATAPSLSHAAGSNTPPRRPGIAAPPSTIHETRQSPASSLGLRSATGQASRRSPCRDVARQSMERGDGLVELYGLSLAAGDPSPALVGGASLPPPSPAKNTHFYVEAVGIPPHKKTRSITNLDENKWEDGFDSDGEQGPFFHAVVDEPADGVAEEDDNLPSSMLESAVMESEHSPEAVNMEPDNASPSWFLTEEQITRLRVEELRSCISLRGLKPKGNKSALQQMLRDCMERQLPIVGVPVANVNELSGFPVGSRWKLLTASVTPAQEPVNMFDFRAPTDNPDLLPTVPKQNYNEMWGRLVFVHCTFQTMQFD